MQVINKKKIVIFICLSIISVFLFTKKDNKENINLKEEKINNKQIALYIEKDNNYEEYRETIFPKGYYLNEEESKCIDNSGNKIEIPIKIENNGITISSNKTVYCTLYLDKSIGLEIIEMQPKPKGLNLETTSSSEDWTGMYRFQGQQEDGIENYICFGTSDSNECTSNPSKYMYRIIGIEESGRIKVIKKEALEENEQWHKSNLDNITWPNSIPFNSLNGNDFLKNTELVPPEWIDKIDNHNWLFGSMNHLHEVYGAKQSGVEVYKIESGQKEALWNEKAENENEEYKGVKAKSSTTTSGAIVYYIEHKEKWSETELPHNVDAKVGLINLSDYYLSVSNEANCNYDNNTYENICNTGWMHITRNDNNSNKNEWTMTRFGFYSSSGGFPAYVVGGSGGTGFWNMTETVSVRPVFYIKSTEELLDGIGTTDEPFIIKF